MCNRPSAGLGTPFVVGDGLSAIGTSVNGLTNCNFSAIMQSDGNFVVFQGANALWSTKTAGLGGTRAIFQGDGNFVVYNAANKSLWNSGSFNRGAVGILLSSAGSLAIVDNNGTPVWTSGSSVGGCY